jgi:uncharacterized protein YyaL (SSP411 family)
MGEEDGRSEFFKSIAKVRAVSKFFPRRAWKTGAPETSGYAEGLMNRLAGEKSPYLLQHAANPVDWFPWGEEAFAKARAEDKPIFLSIGYSTCHWCHVMEHESFESAAIAAFLSEHFVSIKVDREERPDVDQVYMTFVQATTGHGGWPMSVWLTPDLRPFFGGTYFPPTDGPARAGFITVLRRIAELWKTERDQIEDKATSLLSALREAQDEANVEGEESWSPATALVSAVNQYARMFDTQEGGFGGAPKFPRPVNLQFLLARAATRQPGTDAAGAMALQTLRQMARGGTYDHVGGGFHRYSVDARWHVPHFEKMLYDQAQLAQVYLTGFQLSGDDFFAGVARDIAGYIERDLTSKDGGFFSAEDADSLPAADAARKLEGAFYVWTGAEIFDALGETRAAEFSAAYGLEQEGNVSPDSDPHDELSGKNVLYWRGGDEEIPERDARLVEDRAVLLARRGLRPRPHLDDKILTSWNGLAIGALARCAAVLGEPSYLGLAQRAARFIREHLFDATTGVLLRSFRQGPSTIHGFATDYAFLISGLLDLYAADFDLAWLTWARQLQDTLDLHFWDQDRGGYFSTADRDPAILLRLKEDYDGAEPAPTSVAAVNLWRMGRLFHNDTMLEHGLHAVRAFSARLEAQPYGMPLLLTAAAWLETPPAHLVIHSPSRDHAALPAMLAEAYAPCLPQLTVLLIADEETRTYFAQRHSIVAHLPEKVSEPTAYVCENYVCQLPVTRPEALRKLLQGVR